VLSCALLRMERVMPYLMLDRHPVL